MNKLKSSNGYLSVSDYINIFFNYDSTIKTTVMMENGKWIVSVKGKDLCIPKEADTLEEAFENAFQLVMDSYGAPEEESIEWHEYWLPAGFWKIFVKKFPYIFDDFETDDDEMYYGTVTDANNNLVKDSEIISVVKEIGKLESQNINKNKHLLIEQYSLKFGLNIFPVKVYTYPKGVLVSYEYLDDGSLLVKMNGVSV